MVFFLIGRLDWFLTPVVLNLSCTLSSGSSPWIHELLVIISLTPVLKCVLCNLISFIFISLHYCSLSWLWFLLHFSLLKINLLFTYIENRVFSHIIYLDYSSFPLLILSWSTPFMSKTKIITLKKDKAKQERKECKRWYENQRPICSHSGVP